MQRERRGAGPSGSWATLLQVGLERRKNEPRLRHRDWEEGMQTGEGGILEAKSQQSVLRQRKSLLYLMLLL